VQTTAQKLAAELDREHESAANRLSEYQQAMKKKIEAASRELEETKLRIQEATAAVAPLDDLEDFEDEDEQLGEGMRGRAVSDPDGHLSPCSSMDSEQDEEHDPHAQSHVEVSLIESHLNFGPMSSQNNDPAPEYCVSEPPSDDEGEREGRGEEKYDQIDVIEVHSFK
jgi:hypothetical protein